MSDLKDGAVNHDNLRRIAKQINIQHSRSIIKGNEILISCVGSIGEIALVSEKEIGFNIARAIARVPLENRLVRRYAFSYLRSKSVQDYFMRELRTVSQPTLNIKQITETPIEIPPLSALQLYEERATQARDALRRFAEAHTLSDTFFTSLQSRAFSGQL